MAKASKTLAEFEDDDDLPPLKPISGAAVQVSIPEDSKEKPVQASAPVSGTAQKLNVIDTHIQEQKEKKADQERKKNIQKQVNFRLSEEEFEKYSKLFGGQGVSFSKAIRMWLDFGFDAIQSGKYEMSPYGIKEKTLRSI